MCWTECEEHEEHEEDEEHKDMRTLGSLVEQRVKRADEPEMLTMFILVG